MKHSIETYKFFFRALANPNRLQIINTLREGKKNVGEICRATGFEQTMVSHNLKVLELHGMVFKKREGKYRYYTLNAKAIKPLMELIDAHMAAYCARILQCQRRRHTHAMKKRSRRVQENKTTPG